jgi:hypothetical protein
MSPGRKDRGVRCAGRDLAIGMSEGEAHDSLQEKRAGAWGLVRKDGNLA